MFIASSYMLYSPSPSGLAGSPGTVPIQAAASGYGGLLSGAAATGHFPVSAFAAPAVSPLIYREQAAASPDIATAVKKPGGGFSVSDILDHRRADQLPKTAACVVVSRRSPSCASSDTRSMSPVTPPAHDLGPASISPPRLGRVQLKFGMDRILAEDSSEPSERYIGSYGDCAPSPPQASSSFTCYSMSPASRVHRLPAPVHTTSGGCDCAIPFCDGRGNVFNPLYAYPAAALTHALGYPTCAIYPTSAHMNAADLEPLLRPHHHHHHLHHQSAGGATNGSGTGSGHHHALTASSGKRKRSWSRAVFSNLQRKGLEKRFQIQKYITKPDRRQLAATLGLTDAQVKVWFQNRRMKWRHSKEAKEELNKQTTNKTDSKTTDLKTNVINNSNTNNGLKNSESTALISNLKPNIENTSEKCSENKLSGAPPSASTAVIAGTKRPPIEASLREF